MGRARSRVGEAEYGRRFEKKDVIGVKRGLVIVFVERETGLASVYRNHSS